MPLEYDKHTIPPARTSGGGNCANVFEWQVIDYRLTESKNLVRHQRQNRACNVNRCKGGETGGRDYGCIL